MGVRGLTTYVNFNQHLFLKKFYLHDCNLVIDGYSLCAQLYQHSHCFAAFGGDYDKIASNVRSFFKNLQKCNINCYVLFDGSYENRKLKTVFSRIKSKIYGAAALDPVTQSTLHIFPMLLWYSFMQVLNEMKIPYTVCEFEADDEIAAFARHLNCPVLSYDSDYFIYNVQYIPMNTLEHKPKVMEEDGKKFYYLECKLYRKEHFVNSHSVNSEMLPLLATLLGNDYIEKRVFNKFFSQLKMPKSKCKNEQQKLIRGLLRWFQTETLESAIAKIIGRLKGPNKKRAFDSIQKIIEGYTSMDCPSLKYFNLTSTVTDKPKVLGEWIDQDGESGAESSSESEGENEESGSEVDDVELTEKGMPTWFADLIRLKRVPSSTINLFTLHVRFCYPQAEDYTDEDAFLCALPILRYIFDILTDFSQEYCIYVCREGSNGYKKMVVGQEYMISRPRDTNLADLPAEELKMYFKHFMSVKLPTLDLSSLDVLPENFRLYMVSILWWVVHCNVPISCVHSLLMCYIMLDVIDEKTGMFRGQHFFNQKNGKKIEEFKQRPPVDTNVDESSLFLNKNKVLYEDCAIANSVLLELFELSSEIKKKPKTYDHKRIHLLAQFQCCLEQFYSLNILCNYYYETVTFSKCYNGTFVYNLATKMANQTDPIKYMEQYIKGASTVLKFYKSLCCVLDKCLNQLNVKLSSSTKIKKKRRKQKKELDEISFLMQGFESEVVI